jgi:hypothetical protein
MKASTKQRIECFKNALPTFLKEQENYKANRKKGRREVKGAN